MSDLPENVILRPGAEDDDNFLYSSWLKSYRKLAGPLPHRWYYKIYQALLDRLYKRPPVKTLVACFRTKPDQIFAWAVYEEHEGTIYLHYCYTKEAFRGMGIASALIHEAVGGKESFVYTFKPRKHAWLVNRGGHFNDRFIREDLPG